MNHHNFFLQPFSPVSPLLHLEITGNIGRQANTLTIHYELLGHLTELAIPAPADVPARKNRLWEGTCFELFLAAKDSPQYWECNLSPAGHWNVYRFGAYRQGMQEEMRFPSLPFSVQKESDSLQLALEVELDKIVQADQPLDIAISGVIELKGGEATYWALIHPGPRADFHRRDSFILEL